MLEIRTMLIVTVLIALIFSAVSEERRPNGHFGNYGSRPCTNEPESHSGNPPCRSDPTDSTTTTTTTEEYDSNDEDSTENSSNEDSAEDIGDEDTSNLTTLERAHWCRLSNGTYLPLGHIYMRSVCSICQCLKSHTIRCTMIQCMPTYCIDNSMPIRAEGQCCTQCRSDPPAKACTYKGNSFPHGSILRAVRDKMQCWCHLGNIECRNYMGSLFESSNLWRDGTGIYIVVVIICVVLIVGLLLCCGCTFLFYFYYNRYQQEIQQAYDQYVNSGGWQPMEDVEQDVFDTNAEEKQVEAGKTESTDSVRESVPPPYSIYNNSFDPVEEQKQVQ